MLWIELQRLHRLFWYSVFQITDDEKDLSARIARWALLLKLQNKTVL